MIYTGAYATHFVLITSCWCTWFITCYMCTNCPFISGFCDGCVLQSNQSWLLFIYHSDLPERNFVLHNTLIYKCEALEKQQFPFSLMWMGLVLPCGWHFIHIYLHFYLHILLGTFDIVYFAHFMFTMLYSGFS